MDKGGFTIMKFKFGSHLLGFAMVSMFVLSLVACGSEGGGGLGRGTAESPATISTDKVYRSVNVYAFDLSSPEETPVNYYSFTTGAAGGYIIALFNVNTDVSWDLDLEGSFVDSCDAVGTGLDESCMVTLTADTTYRLKVTNLDDVDATLDMVVESP